MRIVRNKHLDAVIDEAAEWVVRINASDASDEERSEFVGWLKCSPEHLREYLKAECTWADLGGVDSSRRVDITALLARDDDNVRELNATRDSAPQTAPQATAPHAAASQTAASQGSPTLYSASTPAGARPRSKRGEHIVAALSAIFLPGRSRLRNAVVVSSLIAVLSCAVALAAYLYFHNRYSTAIGEQRTLKLAEGSTVVLNTHTTLRVSYTGTAREVRLLEGEALFNVAKDPERPFRVHSDGIIAQAVGTSFLVRRKSTETLVTVLEGEVAVMREAESSGESWRNVRQKNPRATPSLSQPLRVTAGVRADIAQQDVRTTEIANPAAVTAWRTGRLIFNGETLAEVVEEFNRYNEVQIVLQGSRLSSERISGVFDAGRPQTLVRFLERLGAIEPAQSLGGRIVLVPRG